MTKTIPYVPNDASQNEWLTNCILQDKDPIDVEEHIKSVKAEVRLDAHVPSETHPTQIITSSVHASDNEEFLSSERDKAYSRLSPSFIPQEHTNNCMLEIPINGDTIPLKLHSCNHQKTLLDFVGICEQDTENILNYSRHTRFCDVVDFEAFTFPYACILGKEEHLETLLVNSMDVLISNTRSAEELNSLIFALLDVLRKKNRSWDTSIESIVNRVLQNMPRGLMHAKPSWILDSALLRQSGRLFSEVLSGKALSICELYLAEKALLMYGASKYNQLANQEQSADLLYCGAVTETLSKPHLRTIDIIAGRNALLGKNKQTLDQIGSEISLTRERVRQIETKTFKQFRFETSERLLSWRMAVVGTSMKSGYGGHLEDLEHELKQMLSFYNDSSFLSLLKLTPDLVIDKEEKSYYLEQLLCSDCPYAKDFAIEIAGKKDCVEISSLIDVLGCHNKCAGVIPSPHAIAMILRDLHKLVIADSLIGSSNCYTLTAIRKPQSMANQIRRVMIEAKEAISAEEVSVIVSERMGKTVSKAHVLSTLSRPEFNCLLWDTSTYIYRKHAPFPKELLERIADSLSEVFLDRKIPILGVHGVFDMYADELRSEGIDYPQALYSLLRVIDSEQLLLREYPWICNSEVIGERTTFAKYFCSVVEANNGFISNEHAEQIAQRAMAQSWQLDGLSAYSPFLMNANSGWYALEAMKIDYEVVENIISEVAKTIRSEEIISAKKIFHDFESLFCRAGVHTFDILYRIISNMEGLPLKASRIPHLVKSDKRGTHTSVRQAIRSYIAMQDKPISSEDLFEYFVVRRGVNPQSLAPSQFLGGRIFEIGNQIYCSEELLNLRSSYIDEFDAAVKAILDEGILIGGFFYPISLVVSQAARLPAISGFEMTRQLQEYIFSVSKEYALVGCSKNCIVSIRDHPEISSDETFYAAIVQKHFDGWATFDDFSEFCTIYNIASKIGPEFFDVYDSIEATDYSIRLV